MLPKVNRLNSKQISRIFKKSKFLKSGFLLVRVSSNYQKDSRFTVIVPKSVAKKATARNKLKRQLHEAIFSIIGKIRPGLDVVVNLKAMPNDTDIKGELVRIFEKLGII